jgi:hypothetical protein
VQVVSTPTESSIRAENKPCQTSSALLPTHTITAAPPHSSAVLIHLLYGSTDGMCASGLAVVVLHLRCNVSVHGYVLHTYVCLLLASPHHSPCSALCDVVVSMALYVWQTCCQSCCPTSLRPRNTAKEQGAAGFPRMIALVIDGDAHCVYV